MGPSWLLRIAQFDPVQERKNSLIFGQCEPGVAKGSRIHSIYNFFVKVKMYLHVLSNINIEPCNLDIRLHSVQCRTQITNSNSKI